MYEKIKKTKNNKIQIQEVVIFSVFCLIIILPLFWVNSSLDEISLEYINYFETEHQNLLRVIAGYSNLLTSTFSYFIITILIFNLSNLFKLIICNVIFILTVGIAAILKPIFNKTMLFALSQDNFLEPYDCWFSWSCPCTTIIYITATFLSIWYMYFPVRLWLRIALLILDILLIIVLNFGVFLTGLYSIIDVAFSMLLGLMIFIFLFFVLKIDVENSKDLKLLLNSNKIILGFNLFVTLTVIILFFTNQKSKNELDSIKKMITYTNCYFQFPDNTDPSCDGLILLGIFLTNYAMIIGIKLEKKMLANNDENKFGFFNFKGDENELESIYTFNDTLKQAQWKNTSCGKTLLRIFFSILICSTELLLILFIPYNTKSLFLMTILLKYSLPVLLHTLYIFLFLKWIFIKFNLVNKDAIASDATSRNSSLSLNDLNTSSLISDEK